MTDQSCIVAAARIARIALSETIVCRDRILGISQRGDLYQWRGSVGRWVKYVPADLARRMRQASQARKRRTAP
jgi:hypothetical protein